MQIAPLRIVVANVPQSGSWTPVPLPPLLVLIVLAVTGPVGFEDASKFGRIHDKFVSSSGAHDLRPASHSRNKAITLQSIDEELDINWKLVYNKQCLSPTCNVIHIFSSGQAASECRNATQIFPYCTKLQDVIFILQAQTYTSPLLPYKVPTPLPLGRALH